ncbi:MAG: 4'-phosphopantetheinyl transferase family protein [Phenylobacterium sp.]
MSDLSVVEDGLRIDIGECCLDTDADIALDAAYADLSGEERERAASFVFDRDRERFVRAHGYLRLKLGRLVQLAPKDVPLAAKEGGKPFVEGHDVSFNLSHSGSRAVVAMTRGSEVGIDLESVDRFDRIEDELDGLARSCLTRDEQSALTALPPERRTRRFLAYWTAKEARMKLTGEGMALEPRTIALKLSRGRPVGYLRPRGPRATLRFIPLSDPDTVCCLAVGRSSATASSQPIAG